MKRREWWLIANGPFDGSIMHPIPEYYVYEEEPAVKGIHVRECLPDEICITREELQDAWTKVKGDFMHPDCADLEKELFGPQER